jgi:hypothetical protein
MQAVSSLLAQPGIQPASFLLLGLSLLGLGLILKRWVG